MSSTLVDRACEPAPSWASSVTNWSQDEAGVWSREFVGVLSGARVRQIEAWADGSQWPAYSDHQVLTPGPSCPSWCTAHLADGDGHEDGIVGIVHLGRVAVGDASVRIEQTTDAPADVVDPVGPVVHLDPLEWVSDETVRNLARALDQAADLIGVPR